MRKLIEATFVSLDGIVESPEKWALPFWGNEHKAHVTQQLAGCDAFLLGRVTYEKFAPAWSRITGDPYYDAVNRLPKYVASTTLAATTWNATRIDGDVAEEVRALKQRPGKDIIKYGTGALDRTLVPHQLIDEFHFSIFPVAVGTGLRVFEGIDTSRLHLKLKDTKTFSNGVVTLTYVPQ